MNLHLSSITSSISKLIKPTASAAKPIFTSKTFWFNALSLSGTALGYIPANPYTLAASAIVNIGLRTISNKAVSIPVINPSPTLSSSPVLPSVSVSATPAAPLKPTVANIAKSVLSLTLAASSSQIPTPSQTLKGTQVMKAGVILLIVRDVVTDLVTAGLLLPTGDFAKLTIAEALVIASSVNATILKYGITEPAQVQQIIAAISTLGPLI